MKNRILSCLLACILLLSLCGTALAAEKAPAVSVAVTAQTGSGVTVQLKVAGGVGSANGRLVYSFPKELTLKDSKSLIGEKGISDLGRTSGSVSFAWACYEDFQTETAVLELTLAGKAGTYQTEISLPEKGVTTSQTLKISTRFTDVQDVSAWYYDIVYKACDLGLMYGVSETRFAPNAKMTRGMLAATLYRMAGSPAVSGSCPYTDVKSGSYYEKAVIWALEAGVAYGTEKTSFSPDALVTRQQAVAMLYRYAEKVAKLSMTEKADLSAFSDSASIAGYAASAMAWAVGAGMMKGYPNGKLMPNGALTRAEAASLLVQLAAKN